MTTFFDVDGPFYVAVRWLTLLLDTLIIGAVVVHDVVLSAGDAERRQRLATLLRTLALWAVGAALLRLLAQLFAVMGPPPAFDAEIAGNVVIATQWGKAWMGQLVALGILIATARDLSLAALRLLAIGMLALGLAFSGHAGAAEFGTAAVVFADVLHVLGAGIWIGGLAVLLATGWTAANPGDFHRIRRRFSTLALTSASVLTATGIAAAGTHGVTFDNLATDPYATLLLRKLVVLALVLALGAWNWRITRAADAQGAIPARFAPVARTEVVFGAIILLITAMLIATATPVETTEALEVGDEGVEAAPITPSAIDSTGGATTR